MNTSKPSKKTSTRFAMTALFLLASLGSGSAALAETPEKRGLTVTIASEIGIDVQTTGSTALVARRSQPSSVASFTFLPVQKAAAPESLLASNASPRESAGSERVASR